VPDWLVWFIPVLGVMAALFGAIPFFKWIKRRRRMKRLEHGDISAAWEDVVGRLTDLGEFVDPTSTPREVAHDVDPAMVPLAVVYGRSLYGETDAVTEDDVATASDALDHTRTRMSTRYSSARRLRAHYRFGELIPRWIRRNPNRR